jgi:resuscitation-promoting factor RpfB
MRSDLHPSGSSRLELYQSERPPATKHLGAGLLCRFIFLLIVLQLHACIRLPLSAPSTSVQIRVDGQAWRAHFESGLTVTEALERSGIELGALDKVDPPGPTPLSDGMEISVIRVAEHLETKESAIPFERQIIGNEALPEGEMRLIQLGKTGSEEIAYRIVEEDGQEKLRTVIKRTIIENPVHEIMMVGAQRSYLPVLFTGKIAYLSAGNAWLIDGTTGNRRPLILSGDLDGRIFRMSADLRWLLFTRQTRSNEQEINSLWVIDINDGSAEPVDLSVNNIIHFADWSPSSPTESYFYSIAYSTVEPRSAPPGWQANNDLHVLIINYFGTIVNRLTILDANPGGQYGWWGTMYAWGPIQGKFTYARPDSIGFVDRSDGSLQPLVEITPYQTQGDWAWIPPFAWSPAGETLFFIDHDKPIGLESPEASPVFHLFAYTAQGTLIGPLDKRAGMFASIACSAGEERLPEESTYRVAYLQAIFPLQSDRSNYRLVVMDRDGSNKSRVFPAEGELGLHPGKLMWSPDGDQIALLYMQDLWIVDPDTGFAQQVTADGQTLAFDWRP